jgi:hypothetical protein
MIKVESERTKQVLQVIGAIKGVPSEDSKCEVLMSLCVICSFLGSDRRRHNRQCSSPSVLVPPISKCLLCSVQPIGAHLSRHARHSNNRFFRRSLFIAFVDVHKCASFPRTPRSLSLLAPLFLRHLYPRNRAYAALVRHRYCSLRAICESRSWIILYSRTIFDTHKHRLSYSRTTCGPLPLATIFPNFKVSQGRLTRAA